VTSSTSTDSPQCRPDVAADRLTASVQATHPTRVVDGWPVLDEQLRWPGTSVYVLGRHAAGRRHGFAVDEHRIDLVGLCSRCR
jgi:hypothetical protein